MPKSIVIVLTCERVLEWRTLLVTVQGDVADLEAMQTIADQVHNEFGAVDVLVNNAGITMDHSFEHMTPEEWQSVVDVNLTGVFNVTKAFYEDIKEADEGRIINISSIIGEEGNFGQANYAASKAGVHGLTRKFAKELARPGQPRTASRLASQRLTCSPMCPKRSRRKSAMISAFQFAQTEDIAPLVRFLASDESRHLTGQVLSVSGGHNL